MARRRFFKFKKFRLRRKQKKQLALFSLVGFCVLGGFLLLLFLRPAPPKPSGGMTSKPAHAFRPSGRPKVVFVIDDIGNHDKLKNQLRALGNKATYAVLPLLPYSRYFGEMSRSTHAEVILHLPLDTVQDKIPGRGLIVDTMSEQDVLDMLARDLDSVPNYVGVNNHMGSRGTANRELMTIILTELKRRNLFFLDSYTTRESTVSSVARKIKLPILTRGVFLDNEDSKPYIRAQLREVRTLAREKGAAIAIGHYRPKTLEVLKEEIPKFEKEGFEIISLKQMLKIQKD